MPSCTRPANLLDSALLVWVVASGMRARCLLRQRADGVFCLVAERGGSCNAFSEDQGLYLRNLHRAIPNGEEW
eukprot:6182792-Pleurochrysis_carterae.AAC.3